MAKRLVKIAKELNVGTGTIVEFLVDKGFEIENKPIAKVTDAMYSELLREFSKDLAVKEKAEQLKKESVPPFEKPTSPIVISQPEPKVETSPASKPVIKKEPTKEPEPEKIKVVEDHKVKIKGLTIKRKIDLSKVGKPKKEEPKPKPVAEAKKDLEEVKVKDNNKPKEEVLKDKPEVKSPIKKEIPKEEPIAESKGDNAEVEKQGVIKAEAPELRGLKIKGKINLSNIEGSRTKSRDKDEKGQPVASSDNTASGGRRRRRRRTDPNLPSRDNNRPGGGPRRDGERRGDSPSRPSPRVSGGGSSRSRVSGGRNRPSNRRSDEPKEVSQKEIDEKIKATLARLSGPKKKRQRIKRNNRERLREKQEALEAENTSEKLQLTEFVSVQELANLMDVPVTDVITVCLNLGIIVGINQRLDAEVIELVASEFGHEVEFTTVEESGIDVVEIEDAEEDLEPRAPIVTVMGHVDHGKTSLLDYIRSSSVVAGEAGGITQHIGAYEVTLDDGKEITFLDTPGHEAFTAMRARGAKVTDIAIIIIAADDDIKPQTKEAISHAEAASVPIIFAINKIDKQGANIEKIKGELAAMNYIVEDWGGKYQSQDVSALTGQGIPELLEKVLLEAEILELKANPERRAVGTVLEASLEKGRGFAAKALITAGTLKIGDPMVAGAYAGKVKAMFNERNKRIKKAGPSTPVLVLGLDGAPQAGENIKIAESEQEAKSVANYRAQISREQTNRATKRISLEEIGRRLALDSFKELNLIIKGDVDGSVEALADSLIKQSIETVQVNVIHKAVGQIIDSDILLASASDAIVVGFQVRPSNSARQLAEREGVQIRTYSIIYEAIDEIRSAIEGLLEPTKEEKIVANVEVRETYKITKVGTIAGCFVLDGKIKRNNKIRLIRDGIVVFPVKENAIGELASLKRFKDDVKEVGARLECGLTIRNFNDIKVGDVIEAYEIIEVKQTLDKK